MELNFRHINNAKILPSRYFILNHLRTNSRGIEIGVLGGDWSKLLIEKLNPTELYLVDTFYSNDYPQQKRFTKKTHESYIKNEFAKYGDNVKIKKGLSWDILDQLPKNYFDWIYIDAAHDYKSVKKDLEKAYSCLKDDGIIIMNDYIMYDHFTKENYGVVKATNEFMIDNDFEMLYFALHPDMFCDVVIKKIQE
jgi:signal peptidase I